MQIKNIKNAFTPPKNRIKYSKNNIKNNYTPYKIGYNI